MVDKKENERKILANRTWIKRFIKPYENVRTPVLLECYNGHCVKCQGVRDLLKNQKESKYFLECPICKKEKEEKEYLIAKPKCLQCGTELSLEQFRDKQKFCSQSCAATYNNNARAKKKGIAKEEKKPVIKIEKETNKNRVNLNSIEKGAIGENALIGLCLKLGIHVSKPVVDSYPYDLILEKNKKVLLFQVKTSEVFTNGIYDFSICRNKYRSGYTNSTVYSSDEFDYFFLYSLYDDSSYIIPIEKGLKRHMYIRKYEKEQYSNNGKECYFSKDLKAEEILKNIFNNSD